MPEIADKEVQAFFESYRGAFEKRDVPSIALHFRFPLQVTGDAGQVTTVVVPSIDAWKPQLERLLAGYRALGVHTAEVVSSHITRLSPHLAVAAIHWRLVTAEQKPVYEFDAVYTLATSEDGLKVTAIAHDEQLRAREAMTKRTAKP